MLMKNEIRDDIDENLFQSSSSVSIESDLSVKLRRKSSHSNSTFIECSKRFSVQSCNILNQLRSNRQLCDGIIKCEDGIEFLIHRAVLSASSRYFLALFTSEFNDSKIIYVKEVDSEVMSHLIGIIHSKFFSTSFIPRLEWCYMRETKLKEDYVAKLLAAADRYDIKGLVEACSEFMKKNLNPENALGIEKFAGCYFLKSLKDLARKYIM